jgi:endonuclease/exonuclease/phosphatase family metal-dependent hydrolase
VKITAWNIARREEGWRSLVDSDADIALLQEAAEPPADIERMFDIDPAPWETAGAGQNRPWRTAVVKLSDRADVKWLKAKSQHGALPGELAVSRLGTLTAAIVTPSSGNPFIVASMYALWEKPHGITESSWIYADGAAHRLISDLSEFVGKQANHRILAAGDLNILYGYGEHGSAYWASRYASVFSRMSTLGLSFVGPQAPAGRCAEPWPDELPLTSKNVPTFHSSSQTPITATRQLDFVFASNCLIKHLRVRALNEPDQWGPSDHCRVEIEIM